MPISLSFAVRLSRDIIFKKKNKKKHIENIFILAQKRLIKLKYVASSKQAKLLKKISYARITKVRTFKKGMKISRNFSVKYNQHNYSSYNSEVSLLDTSTTLLTQLKLNKASSVFPLNSNLVFSNLPISNNKYSPAFHKAALKHFRHKSVSSQLLRSNITPWLEKTFCLFISATTGMRTVLQSYPFLSRELDPSTMSLYRNWIPRLSYYQKRLGHRFFMEETIHIMHLALSLHDASLFSSWLTSLIKRISFWKTRSIFRYMLYLFKNFFLNEFSSVGCKGIKIRLKGKISAAGNSRKRRVNFKFGKVSYSTLKHKCLSCDSLISTFTGVMCLRTEIFY